MIWLNPVAWFAILAVVAPILIHLLVHRRAERFPFPTLRFIQPTRLAAIRRRVLDDVALLGVRVAILALAAAALAGPLVVTPARRAAWNARLVRATASTSSQPATVGEPAFLAERFEAKSLRDAIHAALVWLDRAPPARRELVITGSLPLGSVVEADVAAVAADIGIRFERDGTLPQERVTAASPVMVAVDSSPESGHRSRAEVRTRTLTLSRAQTSVHDDRSGTPATWPVEVVARDDAQAVVDAAISAVLQQRVRAPMPDRKARLVIADRGFNGAAGLNDTGPIRSAWMADAIAQIASDDDVQAEASRASTGLDDKRFDAGPWQPLIIARDGRPVVSAAASTTILTIASAFAADSLATPVLLRAIANSLAPTADEPSAAEVLPIPDDQLRVWTRTPTAVSAPRVETVERDDRRWLWAGVLMLLALEWWMRRSRGSRVETRETETARVA